MRYLLGDVDTIPQYVILYITEQERTVRHSMTHDAIRACRKKAGLTQKQLGHLLGVAQTTIAGWENGSRSLTIDTVRRIAEALNVPVSDLIPDQVQAKAHEDFSAVKEILVNAGHEVDDKGLQDSILSQGLMDELHSEMSDAEVLIRHKVEDATKNIPDKYLLCEVEDMFSSLNRAGKYELYKQALLLYNSGLYNKQQ